MLLHIISALPTNSDLIGSLQTAPPPQQKPMKITEESDRIVDFKTGSNERNSNEVGGETAEKDGLQRSTSFDELNHPQSVRQNKMLGFYGYFANPFPAYAPVPAFYPSVPMEFFGGYPDFSLNNANFNDDLGEGEGEDDFMSRANSKRRPTSTNHFKNSPIYYIRLPPTPYMFVPGVGYISNPPTIQPLTPLMPPTMPTPLTMNPFYNLPLNFVSNAKPTGVYQWNAPSVPSIPSPNFGVPPNNYQLAQRPQRPYRPYPRPQSNPYSQDSKVTHLKGQFLFNGRPEEIYLLPNIQNPFNAGFYSDPYSYNNYNQGYNGYY